MRIELSPRQAAIAVEALKAYVHSLSTRMGSPWAPDITVTKQIKGQSIDRVIIGPTRDEVTEAIGIFKVLAAK